MNTYDFIKHILFKPLFFEPWIEFLCLIKSFMFHESDSLEEIKMMFDDKFIDSHIDGFQLIFSSHGEM